MVDFFLSNWQMILFTALSCLGGLVVILKAVAPLTPTQVDDKALSYLSKLVSFLSGLVTPNMKPPA